MQDKKFTAEQLHRLGFIENEWTDCDETFREYFKDNGTTRVEVSDGGDVEITIDEINYIPVTHCESVHDLKVLLKIFNI